MPHSSSTSAGSNTSLARWIERSQLEFEVDFFTAVLARHPDYPEVLRVHGNNLTLSGRVREGLEVDQHLIALKPNDPIAHYNLACSYALLKKPDPAFSALRRAVELGYRDFRYMREDRDLAPLRSDPRFKKLLREFEHR